MIIQPDRFERRPTPDEYFEYYETYTSRVPDGSVIDHLDRQRADTMDLLRRIPPDRESFSYGPGKWTTKEVIGHVIDTEWIMAGRALWIARGQADPLPGMDQDEFVAQADFSGQSMRDLITHYSSVRQATLALFRTFDRQTLDRRGVASGHTFSVRALIHIIVGHELHHVGIIRERYLPD